VTLDGITPAIQGQPTVTIDASELDLPEQKKKKVFPVDAPPFTAPAATQTVGGPTPGLITIPVRPSNYNLFCSYSEALALAAKELADLKANPNVTGEVTTTVVDGIVGTSQYPPGFPQFQMSTPPSNPPKPTDVSIWVIFSYAQQVVIPQETPTIPAFTGPAYGSDIAGDLVMRSLEPDALDEGPTGDLGGNTLYMKFLAPTDPTSSAAGMLGYWNPAQQ
jgi:hypothetical protein